MNKELTDKQKEICKKDGKFVVRACPGSGKTFTVTAKMAKLLKNWQYSHQGVAVISFTNVAWQEIQKELNTTFSVNIPVKHPHFLGTIDSFINNFIFFPYGHLILKCESKPVLAGEPAYSWKIKDFDRDYRQYFDKVSFDIDGNIITKGPIGEFFFGKLKKYNKNGSINGHYKKIESMKKRFLRRGYANQSDADYFSMKLLEKYPSIAKIIALRFPFIIIDEAQDTSEIQMRIIDILVENGLKNLILVGDPDQAIFEWNDAKPKLFNEKIKKWADITMNESWRSSRNICQFTFFLSSLEKPSRPVNEKVVDHNHIPEIVSYDLNNVDFNKELINPFLEICKENKIIPKHSTIAVLARSKSLIDEIILSRNNSVKGIKYNNRLDVWYQENFTKELALSRYLYDKFEFQKSFKLLEKTYVSIKKSIYSDYELSELIEKIGYFNFKTKIFDLINLMPKTDISVGEWIIRFKENLDSKGIDLELSIKDECQEFNFDELFGYDVVDNEYPYLLSTIHKVKGETFEAVLLILKKGAMGPYYRTLLNDNKNTGDNEELRNVYVGITRPKKVLVLAVPSNDKEVWDNYFSDKVLPEEVQTTLFEF
jgi:DNA helicase II / ATP-dependent DNA helicase PcrA